MTWIVASMKWIMLVSGVLTFTMIYAAIAPQAALLATFGETLEGPVADIVVRSWGALIAIVGAMLVYGAFRPASRPLVLVVAGVSKLIFIGLVVTQGAPYLGQAAVPIVADLVMVAIFALYLLAAHRLPAAAESRAAARSPIGS